MNGWVLWSTLFAVGCMADSTRVTIALGIGSEDWDDLTDTQLEQYGRQLKAAVEA